MSAAGIAGWALAGGVLIYVGWAVVRSLASSERRARLRVRAHGRVGDAERTAVEAALDDPLFSPEQIRSSVHEVLDLAASVWRGGEASALAARYDAALIRSWAHSRESWVGKGLRPTSKATVDLLRVANRGSEAEDRVSTRVRFALHRDPHASALLPGDQTVLATRTVHLDERWTLAPRQGRWYLVSVAGDPLSGPVLSAPLIASPAQDRERLEEQSLQELARHDSQSDITPGELADMAAPPPLELLDLSVADDRFSPLLIGAAINHLVEAWEEASDDSENPLDQVATKHAICALLHPKGPAMRRFIRDATLKHWEVREIAPRSTPPMIQTLVGIAAAVYESRDGFVSGSDTDIHDLELVWRLALHTGEHGEPRWLLHDSTDR